MIQILTDGDATNVISLDGTLATVVHVDDYFRVEVYSHHPLKTCKDYEELEKLWEWLDLYWIGEYKTLDEAVRVAIKEILPQKVSQAMEKHGLLDEPLSNNDWLIESKKNPERELVKAYKEWVSEDLQLRARANEYEREAEYYETYEPDPKEATRLYDRAGMLEDMAYHLEITKDDE